MTNAPDTAELLDRAEAGDRTAVGQLLQRHRERLRRMVAVHIDPRLSVRVDPSDVVQDAVADAAGKLDDYLRDRPLPFYPWLRQITWQRLIDTHRRHVKAEKRSVGRETAAYTVLPDRSAAQLADHLVARSASPSRQAARKESQQRVREALLQLSEHDREVLVLIYLEQLSPKEAGDVLAISEKAVTMRHLRALDRLRPLVDDS